MSRVHKACFLNNIFGYFCSEKTGRKLLAGAAKPSCSPDGDVKLFYVDEFNLFKFCDNHLGNAFTGFYGLGSVGKVNQDTLYLSAVVAVDGTGCVEQRQSTFCR
ncbi:MAG: hypothetical protein RIQ78_166 [Bacteroidota bacterium]